MNLDIEKCYEVLGAKPGASAQELKAAYKDMAKVWHPDRFTHDPPLQKKAQEKLKEINEAYAQLTSSKSERRTRTARPTPETRTHGMRAETRHTLPYIALLVFAISFVLALAIHLLNSRRDTRGPDKVAAQTASTTLPEAEEAKESEAGERPRTLADNTRKSADSQKPLNLPKRPEQAETIEPRLRPLPTVTITIDPTTGLIATADCSVKQSMTYPSGKEPRQYCTADHRTSSAAPPQQQQEKSSVRSAARRVLSPKTWFGKKEKKTEQ